MKINFYRPKNINPLQSILKLAVSLLTTLIAVAWLGLRIKPKPFPPFPQPPRLPDTMPLPEGLPAPVTSFYYQLYGDHLPLIESAVLSGRATMRLGGITFPGRFRFTHLAGQSYRHYIESTLFGLPLLKVNEHYLDGVSRMALPFGVIENDPNVNQGANLALWAEAMWFPSIFISDPRVRWEAVDDHTAQLIVPFAANEETFAVRFNAESGLPHRMETLRFKAPNNTAKTPWRVELQGWSTLAGHPLFTVGKLTWLDEETPWAQFTVEEAVFNADVSDYIYAGNL